ncbi:hypothetical protein Fuma_03018 [Fuerstiella marisgermanici]|uniref:Uncharacterized protein n=1 Tax=Fuerstiella marisgermanici TaxID=1891926 RepID=A0A1P8WH48_9PLAN|nr:hypothetical protein Fuma_03018 [Fuerstiella marisgermanici]
MSLNNNRAGGIPGVMQQSAHRMRVEHSGFIDTQHSILWKLDRLPDPSWLMGTTDQSNHYFAATTCYSRIEATDRPAKQNEQIAIDDS